MHASCPTRIEPRMDIECKCQEIWETPVGHEGSPTLPADPLETLHPYQVI